MRSIVRAAFLLLHIHFLLPLKSFSKTCSLVRVKPEASFSEIQVWIVSLHILNMERGFSILMLKSAWSYHKWRFLCYLEYVKTEYFMKTNPQEGFTCPRTQLSAMTEKAPPHWSVQRSGLRTALVTSKAIVGDKVISGDEIWTNEIQTSYQMESN